MGYWINKSEKIFKRNIMTNVNNIHNIRLQRNNIGVFSTPYRYDKKEIDDATMIGNLYFDFDCKEDFEKVRIDALRAVSYLKIVYRIDPSELVIYFSGNKGVHIIVPSIIFGAEPSKELNRIYKFISQDIRKFIQYDTLDPKVYDNKRMFRLPYSKHETSGYYKTPITIEELRNTTLDDIKKLSSSIRKFTFPIPTENSFSCNIFKQDIDKYEASKKKKNKTSFNSTINIVPNCIKKLLEEGAVDGSRNNSLAALTSFCRNWGLTYEKTVYRLSKWNDVNIPPICDTEFNSTINSIFYNGSNYGCTTYKELGLCNDEDNCKLKGGPTNE